MILLLAFIALLGGIGRILPVFGRYSGWHAQEERRLRFLPPGQVALMSARRCTAWYLLAVAALLLVQTLLGVAPAHYHAETGSLFGSKNGIYMWRSRIILHLEFCTSRCIIMDGGKA